jgi:amino acid permease
MLMSSVFSQENSVNKESEGQTAETRCTIVLTGLIVILVLFLLLLWCFASFFSKESLSEIREKREGPGWWSHPLFCFLRLSHRSCDQFISCFFEVCSVLAVPGPSQIQSNRIFPKLLELFRIELSRERDRERDRNRGREL